MARITVEDCLSKVKNRFELVLLAAKRARLISRKGLEPLVEAKNHKATVIALKEIAKGLISPAILQQTDEEIINAASEDLKSNQ